MLMLLDKCGNMCISSSHIRMVESGNYLFKKHKKHKSELYCSRHNGAQMVLSIVRDFLWAISSHQLKMAQVISIG